MLVVEDEPYMAEAIRDGLRLEAIAADVAGDGGTALKLLSFNDYDIAVLDRDIPGPSGDEIAARIVASGSGMPILMLTAADRLDDKATGFELGADDYLTKPFELRELVLRLRALNRRRANNRPPVREIAGLRLDPFRREVYRDGRYVALTRKQFAVLEVLVAAEGGVVSAEELLERAWDENADPFTNAPRITVSGLRKRLGEPWIIATVPGAGYRIDTRSDTEREEKGVDRATGLSVRLKLTLSYAGFLRKGGGAQATYRPSTGQDALCPPSLDGRSEVSDRPATVLHPFEQDVDDAVAAEAPAEVVVDAQVVTRERDRLRLRLEEGLPGDVGLEAAAAHRAGDDAVLCHEQPRAGSTVGRAEHTNHRRRDERLAPAPQLACRLQEVERVRHVPNPRRVAGSMKGG